MRRTLLALAAGVVATLGCAGPAHSAVPTIVTFTFDDGTADHVHAGRILQQHGWAGTFYVNSGKLGGPQYLTDADVQALQNVHGQEIGGHTKDHVNLTRPGVDLQDQICGDFTALLSRGLDVTSFAYPHGADSPQIHDAVRGCTGPAGQKYTSARTTRGLTLNTGGATPDCDRCAEPLPLGASWAFRTRALQIRQSPRAVEHMTTAIAAARDENKLNAGSAGSWLQFVLHDVCDPSACSATEYGIQLEEFRAVVSYVKELPASDCVVVLPVKDVVNKPLPSCPAQTEPPADPPASPGGGGGGGGGAATPASTALVAAVAIAEPPAPAVSVPAPPVVALPKIAPPAVDLIAPPRGTAVRGVVELGARITPVSDVAKVEYLVDGRVVATRTRAPFTVRWATGSRRGRVVLAVRVTDIQGTVASSAPRSLRVLAPAPRSRRAR